MKLHSGRRFNMAYPKCDACGIDIYPVIKRVFGGCCTDCRDRIDAMKERQKLKEEENNVQKRINDNQTT